MLRYDVKFDRQQISKNTLSFSLSLSLSLIHLLYNCRTCAVVITEFSFQLPQNSIKNDYLSAALPLYSQYESLATRACGSFFYTAIISS